MEMVIPIVMLILPILMHLKMGMHSIHFISLVGPTGIGKSALALKLAQSFPVGIINADSRQVYKAFPIITAQPSAREQNICPHALYGFMRTREKLTAGLWAKLALQKIQAYIQQGRIPLLVGGTGLYLRALTDGIVDIPPIPQKISAMLEDECTQVGSEALHKKLQCIDPNYANRIHPHDRQRIIRALEVFETTGKTFSWWHTQTPPPLDAHILRLGVKLPLKTMTPIFAMRIEHMLAKGAKEEVEKEYSHCPEKAPGWSGIGCLELYSWLHGDCTFDKAKELWIHNTRAYAKRQLTWFQADQRIHWSTPDSTDSLLDLIEQYLN